MDNRKNPAGCGDCEARKRLAAAVDELLAQELMPPATQEEALEDTVSVVDVRFRSGGKIYYFDPNGLTLRMGDHVILDTARGAEYAVCASGCHAVSSGDIVAPLRKVIRAATEQDKAVAAANRVREKRAFRICQQKIAEHGLEMQLVSAECAFDGSKILFFFTADGRVDFRELVKSLAATFRTRIELRQIGVRDKAKMIGGLGVCGKPFCCSQFLSEFQPVSIKMAKTQNLSLNPGKISGTCGRLMCCLKYEQEAYEDLLKRAPKLESFVDTPGGRGTVCDVNLLRQTVRVRMEDHPEVIEGYANSEIAVLRSGKARKGDAPIPREVAPISGNAAPRRKPVELPEEDSMPSIFKKLDEYAASSGEPAEQERRKSRRRRKGGKPEGADLAADRLTETQLKALDLPEEREGKSRNHRRKSRRPRR